MPNGQDSFFLKPLGLLVTILVVVVGAAVANQAALYNIRSDMKDALYLLDTRMIAAEYKLSRLPPRDTWRGQDMYIWSRDLKDANDELVVPDPRITLRDRSQTDTR